MVTRRYQGVLQEGSRVSEGAYTVNVSHPASVSQPARPIRSAEKTVTPKKGSLMVSHIYTTSSVFRTHQDARQDKGTVTTKNGEPRWICGICQRDVVARTSDVGQHLRSHDPTYVDRPKNVCVAFSHPCVVG